MPKLDVRVHRLERWLLVGSTFLFAAGVLLAALAVGNCRPTTSACPTDLAQSLHPLFRGVRLATGSAVLLGIAFLGYLLVGVLHRSHG